MQPRTSVRQPVIAGARRQHLKELLRRWRRQPRKRSPLLFWTLLSLALMSDSALLFLTARLLGLWGPTTPTAERSRDVPYTSDSSLSEPPTENSWFREATIAPQALYSSLLAAGLFAAAAAVRLRWPLWRRLLLFAGMLSCLGFLVWSGSELLRQPLHNGGPLLCESSQTMLWLASVVLGLGIFLAVLFRDAFIAFVAAVTSSLGCLAANCWSFAFSALWLPLTPGTAGDTCLRTQGLTLLSAFAMLALAWNTAALTLTRILLHPPSSERVRRLAHYCVWPIRIGVVLLVASALLDGWRELEQGPAWHRGNAQALGTLLVLPGCVALLYAWRRGILPPFRLLTAVVLGIPSVVLMWHLTQRWESGDLHIGSALAADVGYIMAGLFTLSLATHASLRYYFGRQRILEV